MGLMFGMVARMKMNQKRTSVEVTCVRRRLQGLVVSGSSEDSYQSYKIDR